MDYYVENLPHVSDRNLFGTQHIEAVLPGDAQQTMCI